MTQDSQWLFPDDGTTPSVLEGMSVAEEAMRRGAMIFWLTELAEGLQILVTFSTCAVYLHRFYMRQSMQQYPAGEMLAPALFLACKVEEDHRRLRDLINHVDQYIEKAEGRVISKTGTELEVEEAFKQRRVRMLYLEDVLLKTLCYDLAVEHPFQDIETKSICFDLDGERAESPAAADVETETRTQRLERVAWLICRDSFASTVCVRFPPLTVAGACLLLAASKLEEPTPHSSDLVKDFHTTKEELFDAAEAILEAYTTSRGDFIRSQASTVSEEVGPRLIEQLDRPWRPAATAAFAPEAATTFADPDDDVEEGELANESAPKVNTTADVKHAEERARMATGQAQNEARTL